MTVVLVEGASDKVALEALAARLGVTGMEVVPIGGAQAARRAVAARQGQRLLGLVDVGERAEFEGVVDETFVCDRDLEDELIRALGVPRVLEVLDEQGELVSFGRLQHQPAQRDRSTTDQLRRFFGGRSGNKARYAALLVDALELDRVPAPLAALMAAVR